MNIKKYLKFSVMIVILACMMFYTAGTAIATAISGEWETYDYSRFDNTTYLYDIGGNFKNIDIGHYNGVLKDMESKYGITYTFILVDDYNDSAWDLAACIREYAGYGQDYISVVISVLNREYDLYTLGKGINIMNDNYVEGMLDALAINLKDGDFDGALDTFIDLAKKMTDSYNVDSRVITDRYGNKIYASVDYSNSTKVRFDLVSLMWWFFIGGVIFASVFTLIEYGKHKPVKKAWNADFYINDENVKMSVIEDRYLRSHETRRRVNNSNSGGSGGGGSRGSGSTHTGSSGRSGGGGSRKF